MLNFLSISANLFYIFLFVVGLFIAKKLPVKAIFYFFIIMIIHTVYTMIASLFWSRMIDSMELPFGMSMSSFLVLIMLIPKLVEITALLFLVIGLYHIWHWLRKNRTIE